MSALGAGLGPFDQLQPEAAQHVHEVAPDFPFVMVTVPAFWVVENRKGWTVGGLIEGGATNPTGQLAFAAHTPNGRVRTQRIARGWRVRPATADEVAGWQGRS